MALKDLVTVTTNNDVCVILEVKPNSFKELIALGCFDGNETMIRVTKGDTNTYTIWKEGGKSFSWAFGLGGYTLVSDATHAKRKLIVNTITKDFGIFIGKYI